MKTPVDVDEYLECGCVAVMLARGIIANPFLFEECAGLAKTQEERLAELIAFAYRARELSGEHMAVVIMKRFAGSVLRFAHGSAELRQRAMLTRSLDDLLDTITKGVQSR